MLKFKAVGVMSGTSLDGVDVTLCSFQRANTGWKYNIDKGNTFSYPPSLFNDLSNVLILSALELAHLNNALSEFWSACVLELIGEEEVDFVAVHGQTVFHQPDQGLTLQLVNASLMATRLQVPVISDFRSADVALGGQGAPLVPVGDALLFGEYSACVN
ncbi:MAG: anhydro-N-acetylmuramic acid kinase, partial [Flavobacteriales bacterium]